MNLRAAHMYARLFKRMIDFLFASIALIVLSPLLLALAVAGAIVMKGNPFFMQNRPGKNEKIFKLFKFRTMSDAKDENGELLPDDARLNAYGRFLRSTSLDELPQLWNIVKGELAVVGPRPLLVKYLPLYSEHQHRRHEVRPGLTGYAQANGRNSITWEEKFDMDVYYAEHITFRNDVRIIFDTIKCVVRREGISDETCATMEEFKGAESKMNIEKGGAIR